MALRYQIFYRHHVKLQLHLPTPVCTYFTMVFSSGDSFVNSSTLSGANPLLLQYANTRIEELDAERQKQLRLVADLTANSVSASQIDSITGYLDEWESVSFDDKRKVVDILISQIDATSESVTIHWKI